MNSKSVTALPAAELAEHMDDGVVFSLEEIQTMNDYYDEYAREMEEAIAEGNQQRINQLREDNA